MSCGDFTARRCRYTPDRFVNAGRFRLRCSSVGAVSGPKDADLLQAARFLTRTQKKPTSGRLRNLVASAASMSSEDFTAKALPVLSRSLRKHGAFSPSNVLLPALYRNQRTRISFSYSQGGPLPALATKKAVPGRLWIPSALDETEYTTVFLFGKLC